MTLENEHQFAKEMVLKFGYEETKCSDPIFFIVAINYVIFLKFGEYYVDDGRVILAARFSTAGL